MGRQKHDIGRRKSRYRSQPPTSSRTTDYERIARGLVDEGLASRNILGPSKWTHPIKESTE